jgi:ATP-binding cassette subfamily F protein 3
MFEGDDALKKISVLSGGERSRVLLGKILATPSNVLLLDEPTNHLDVESVMALTDALAEFDGAVVIVTHGEEILRRVANRLIVFQGDVPFVFEGTYDEFLDSIGWEGEEENMPSRGKGKRAKSSAAAAGDPRREKAALLQERSRVLTPLRAKVSELEGAIATSEAKIAELEKQLETLSASGKGADIQQASQELAKNRRDLQERMTAWEEAEKAREEAERSFQEKLAVFGGA